MRWKGKKGSDNVEDRRGGRGGGSPVRRVGTGIGLGTIVIMVIAFLLGENPLQFLSSSGGAQQPAPVSRQAPGAAPNDELGQFVSVVLKYTEDVWTKIFREQANKTYQKPVLVLYDGQVRSACGNASSATGPFYCPGDHKLYIDLSFYRELKERFNAPGDFAMAYIVAHEVAHHVQNLLGITGQVDRQRGRISKTEYNKLSVRLELQADFLAGVWAHYAHKMDRIIEEGDIEEAMRAAAAVGDDRIQMKARGYVVPDAFTHGTSEQRMRWFRKGLETGDLSQMDTFSARDL